MAEAAGDVSFSSSINGTLTPQRLFSTSTPFKVPNATARKGKGKKKTFVRPVCDVCDVCKKEYRCHRSFLNHKRSHTMQDAASKYPDRMQILNHCMSTSKATIDNVLIQAAASTSQGNRYRKLVSALMDDNVAVHSDWSEALDKIHCAVTISLDGSKLLMPSALINILIQNAEKFLSDLPLRDEVCALIEVCIPVELNEKSLINIFITDYAYSLVKSILKYYADSLKDGWQSNGPSPVVCVVSDEEKEVVHFVGGAVVREFYRKSRQFPKNVGWKNIGRAISEKLLENEFVPGPPASVKGWTKAQDRGGLFFISGALFDFFVNVAATSNLNTTSKRVNIEKVVEEVSSGAGILLWDEAVGDSLSENQSYSVMCGMVKSFCSTYANGHTKRLINEHMKKAEASVPLRHNVAPRN